ncbi:MAG TPA: DNA alkylation repair protein [Anaerolineales bacterium]|jgi:3-methyladenine DNA glycosylase AlkD
MHEMVAAQQKLFQQHADPTQAGPMSAYMRNQFPYLGIKSPLFAGLNKQFYSVHGLPRLDDLDVILRELWGLPEREYQYAAASLLSKFERQLPPAFIETIEYLLVTKSWWDTVDTISGGTLGMHFQRFPDIRIKTLSLWRLSPNFWLRRASILFQLNYKKSTDFPLLCDIIRENLGSKEFFINKAIGWSLRQYSRVDPQAVSDFVAQTPLHPLSAREALKWLENGKHRPAGSYSKTIHPEE